MRPYRELAVAPTPAERCDECGLELEQPVELDDDDAPWRGIAAETVIAFRRARILRERFHGEHAQCPGPPRVELVPVWRALLELVALA